ncbi:MAG: CRTAC1 family protein [Rhodobacteraceae bacterium]|nr:CRTAC1 family protein [Paracoccaceae bacterium]
MRLISSIALICLPAATLAGPTFTNVAPALRIHHQYTGGWEHFVGGGVATFDCNADLLPDLFVAGGDSPAALLINTSTRGGDVSFTENTPDLLQMTGMVGAYPLDIDSDGILDLFVMRVSENHIFKGGPDCSFTAFSDLNFSVGNHWTTAFSATWEGANLLPTLAIGNYVDRNDPDGPFEACDTSFLVRPDGQSYGPALRLEPSFCPLSMLFSDWGRLGRQDLRVSNDRHYYVRGGGEQLWAMEDTPRLYDTTDGWRDFSIWGMGIASRDISGDGIPEVFLTSMADQKLQNLAAGAAGPSFDDATYDRGTTAHRPYTGGDGRPSTGWHVAFGDVNNDGLDDVFIAKGNVEQMPASAMDDPNNLLMQTTDGRFVEAGEMAGIATMDRSRGGALVDLNLDGLLDIVVVNRRADLEILENISDESGNWILLEISQNGTNPQAVGAWIELQNADKTWHREITVGGGHASGRAGFEHFGLGSVDTVQLRVIWPDGTTSDWLEVSSNQILRIKKNNTGLTANPL